jgi:PKD repeat protein
MKRVLVALMLSVVLPHLAIAQQTGGRVAYDYCDSYFYWYENDWVIVYTCNVVAFDIGGSSMSVGEGFDPALSPDGTRIAFVVGAVAPGSFEPSDIIVVDLRDGTSTNLTANDPAPASSPAWSWDGRLAFESSRSGSWELYVINPDGTGLAQLTNGIGFRGYPTWSPDGRIAFECTGETGGQNLCSINSDGTGFRRLTGAGGDDREPAFSPDGTRIAFVTSRFASWNGLAILNADGTVTPLADAAGNAPTWSPDGRQLAFSLPDSGGEGGIACNADGPCLIHAYAAVYAIDLATGDVSVLSSGANPSWAQSPPGGFPPVAVFTGACTLVTCTFDASRSLDEGTIASYAWSFGDGTTGTGITALHTYPRGGHYIVDLVVVDDAGMRGTFTGTIDVTDAAPVASFTRECSGLICRFDASGSSDSDGLVVAYAWTFGDGTILTTSDPVVVHQYRPGTYTVRLTVSDNLGARGAVSHEITVVNNPPVASFEFSCDASMLCIFTSRAWDPDGTIVSYAWQFGDGTSAVGAYVTHTYGAAGAYSVTLTVTDYYGATNSHATSVTVVRGVLHVGDLDGAKNFQRGYWTAFVIIRIHDADHRPVNARVDGAWSSGGSSYCDADSSGTCLVATVVATSVASVTFTVQSVSFGSAVYDPTRNHDVDSETNGTSITITRK